MEVSMPTGSLCSERNVIGTALAADHTLHRQHIRMIAVLSVTLKPSFPTVALATGSNVSLGASVAAVINEQPRPLKRIKYGNGIVGSVNGTDNTSPVLSPMPGGRPSSVMKHRGEAGLNPTSPCGSCNEWLRKIAELNPDFKVITFTDETCEQVFINSVK